MKVGKAKYSTGKNTFYVKKDETFIARILPALGKLADAGTWRVFYSVQWGFKNSSGKLKPFLDPFKKNFNTKMIEVESAARLLRETLNAKKDELKALSKANPEDQALLTEYEKYKLLVTRYNLDNNNYINVVTIDNKIGLLKVGTKFKNSLVAAIDKELKNGVDPLDPDKGMYFAFHKTNPSPTNAVQDWVHTVAPYKENVQAQINGQTVNVEQQKYHTMDDAFNSRLSNEAFELSGMYPAPTSEEVQRLVSEGSVAVDEILGSGDGKKEKPATSSVTTNTTPPAVSNPTLTNTVQAVVQTPVEVPVTTPPTAADTVLDLIDKGELANPSTKAVVQPPTVVPTTVSTAPAPATTTSASPSSVSDDDFLASLNISTQ